MIQYKCQSVYWILTRKQVIFMYKCTTFARVCVVVKKICLSITTSDFECFFFSSVHYMIRCRTVLVGQYICFQAMYFIPFFVWWCRICGLALDWWIVLCRSQKSHHTCLHFHSKREVSRWKKKISSNIHYQKWDYTFRPFGTERAF